MVELQLEKHNVRVAAVELQVAASATERKSKARGSAMGSFMPRMEVVFVGILQENLAYKLVWVGILAAQWLRDRKRKEYFVR